ncbi:MAG: hypothetical protein NTZ05_18610, partial [Chloroflexi bacterium]|nr:hypothetical protein [Chloroflexota bacterium]
MAPISLFPNEYRELLRVASSAEAHAAADPLGNWEVAPPPGELRTLAAQLEQAVAQTERDYQALGRRIWLTRPEITDEEFARLDAEHGEAERRIRVLSRLLAAFLDAEAGSGM